MKTLLLGIGVVCPLLSLIIGLAWLLWIPFFFGFLFFGFMLLVWAEYEGWI